MRPAAKRRLGRPPAGRRRRATPRAMRALLILPVTGLLALAAQHGTTLLGEAPVAPRTGAAVPGGVLHPHEVIVVDGDTIRARGRTIRLLGFDTPETHEPQCAEEARLGRAATNELRRLLRDGDALTLHLRPEQDRYGRDLGRLAVDGHDVGPLLVAKGLARTYSGGTRGGWC